MHRLIAMVLGLALAATCAGGSARHIHVYADHDHPEHHHGLSAHEHHRPATAQPDEKRVRLEGCDPARHSISFAFVCAAPAQIDAIDADVHPPASVSADPEIGVRVQQGDVRVHGPPPRTQAAPRAPPPLAHL